MSVFDNNIYSNLPLENYREGLVKNIQMHSKFIHSYFGYDTKKADDMKQSMLIHINKQMCYNKELLNECGVLAYDVQCIPTICEGYICMKFQIHLYMKVGGCITDFINLDVRFDIL